MVAWSSTAELYTVPLSCCSLGLACNLVASLVLPHTDIDGAPLLCLMGNLVLCCIITTLVMTGLVLSDGSAMEWLCDPINPAVTSWEHSALWIFLVICVKDLPWLVYYNMKLISLHHVVSLIAILVFVSTAPVSGNMFTAMVAVLEQGSMLSTIVNFYPQSSFMVSFFFLGMTASNVIGFSLAFWHWSLCDWSVYSVLLMLVTPVLLFLRQQATNRYRSNFKTAGHILGTADAKKSM